MPSGPSDGSANSIDSECEGILRKGLLLDEWLRSISVITRRWFTPRESRPEIWHRHQFRAFKISFLSAILLDAREGDGANE